MLQSTTVSFPRNLSSSLPPMSQISIFCEELPDCEKREPFLMFRDLALALSPFLEISSPRLFFGLLHLCRASQPELLEAASSLQSSIFPASKRELPRLLHHLRHRFAFLSVTYSHEGLYIQRKISCWFVFKETLQPFSHSSLLPPQEVSPLLRSFSSRPFSRRSLLYGVAS